jgi:hypothetical protein
MMLMLGAQLSRIVLEGSGWPEFAERFQRSTATTSPTSDFTSNPKTEPKVTPVMSIPPDQLTNIAIVEYSHYRTLT